RQVERAERTRAAVCDREGPGSVVRRQNELVGAGNRRGHPVASEGGGVRRQVDCISQVGKAHQIGEWPYIERVAVTEIEGERLAVLDVAVGRDVRRRAENGGCV